uniref:Lipase_3 domain-containing protein n=1 Tax=Steinernema glaseri TaxID=37863 RepID=A0A1I7Z1L4_9BILA
MPRLLVLLVLLPAHLSALVILPRPQVVRPKTVGLPYLTNILDSLPNAAYEDEIVRKKLFPMSAAAYSDAPQKCLHNVFRNASLERQVTRVCDWDREATCSAFVAVAHDDRAIIIAFRGTTTFLQLLTEAGETLNEHVEFITGGKVSKYFFDAFNIVWHQGVKDAYLTLRSRHPDYEVWITGHSLGGAMASLCAASIVKLRLAKQETVKLVTLGQPRTGNRAYAQAHDQLLGYSFRVVHRRDMVPHLPSLDFANYHHHKSEVWYDNDMDATHEPSSICYADESYECSNGLIFTLSIPDHLNYFGRKVSKFGYDGCLSS